MRFLLKRSITRDLTICLIALVGTLSMVIIAFQYRAQKKELSVLLEARADEYTAYLVESLEWPLWSLDDLSINQIAQSFLRNDYIQSIEIGDETQKYFTYASEKKSDALPQVFRKAAIMHNGKQIGQLVIGLSDQTRQGQIKRLAADSIRNLIVILILLGGMIHLMLTFFLKHPLNQFILMIRTAAQGDYDLRMEKPAHIELEAIYTSFKQMARQIGAREEALRESALRLSGEVEARKQSEIEREKLIKELEQRNAELERFTYTISHDLKSPLITIKGFLGYVRKSLNAGDPQQAGEDLERISQAADRMNRLLGELLELSRIGRLKSEPEQFTLKDITTDVCDNMAPLIAEKQVHIDVTPENVPIFGDRSRIREVYENLVDNAIKFMGAQSAPRIEIGTRRKNGQRVLYVSDNGMGIEKAYHDRVFNMFERLNPGIDGTGIGLAIVKRVIEIHGGEIWVESEGEGKGATFCMTLPEKPKEA